ncbi:hypothetical protein DFH06DRAFT_1325209 [Mycena polygramma]|nr:hypothetical protein DFH06DRAFT_1339899 [Mycena polygramma]KAJ7661884.1 hypothetical protein DFH06DRAFT_1325209 [Mycena polygramma]
MVPENTCRALVLWQPSTPEPGRGLSTSDLQRGERYLNSDYTFALPVFHAAVHGNAGGAVILSEQGERPFSYVCGKYVDGAYKSRNVLTPTFHAASHNFYCTYDIACQWPARRFQTDCEGQTDGEGVERAWACSAPMLVGKEMAPGKRHDALWSTEPMVRAKFEALCHSCCVIDHRSLPLHFLKEWTGTFWDNVTLCEIGLVYQLGHRGRQCPSPASATRSLLVYDTKGVQTVKCRHCACESANSEAQQILDAGWLLATPEGEHLLF